LNQILAYPICRLCLVATLAFAVRGETINAEKAQQESARMFAAVLLIRGTAVGGNIGAYGVYVRNTGDSNWTKITRSNVISFGLGLFKQGTTRRHYLAAGNGLHRSTDAGQTWRVLTCWTTEEILCVVPDPVDSAMIYVATPFGVFKTTDDGITWDRKMTGFKKWFIQRIIMDKRDRHTLYAASEDDIYMTTNGGAQWSPMRVGAAEPLALLQHPTKPNRLLAGFEENGLRYSPDHGTTWIAAKGLSGSTIYTISASADGTDLYAAGWKTGLWRSEDGGLVWNHVWSNPAFDAIYSIFVDPTDGQHVFVGSVGGGVYESHDRGKTWRSAGLVGGQIKQIELYP